MARWFFAELDRDSSILASQLENSSSAGADAVEDADSPRLSEGRMLRGLLKRDCLPLAMDGAGDEECCERRVYEASSEERSREESERLGPGWKDTASARASTGSGSGSWKRTVRLGFFVDVVVDVKDVWPEERMEDWSVLA